MHLFHQRNLNGIQTDLLLLKPVCIPLIKIIR